MTTKRLSVCLVAHKAYGALTGGASGFIGGVEWQTFVLARFLSNRGHKVTVLTWDEGGGAEEILDGIRVLKICRADAGLPGLRFFVPKWTSLTAALAKADADVYFHNCSECVTGQVALWCRSHRRAFVFSLASNADCDVRLPELKTRRERILYRMGLRRATHIIGQTKFQQHRLKATWNLDSEVIPMASPGPSSVQPRKAPDLGRVLWVGRVSPVKRLEWYLDIATQCPWLVFDLVGPFGDDAYGQQIRSRAQSLRNVVLHGRIAKSDLGRYYSSADFLFCTSHYEGFPNTFLEAWSYGVPVITTFDPDDVVRTHSLGAHAQDLAGLLRALDLLREDRSGYASLSKRVRNHYEQNHQPELVLPLLERALVTAAGKAAAGSNRIPTEAKPMPVETP